MRALFLVLFFVCTSQGFAKRIVLSGFETGIVKRVQKIDIEGYPEAFNPSLCAFQDRFILIFRVIPDNEIALHSEIGALFLDKDFRPVSEPILLRTRDENAEVISQSEDARLIDHKGRYFLVYNDNEEELTYSPEQRRDIFVTELVYEDETIRLLPPTKFIHDQHHKTRMWEKNWTPFIWNDLFLLIYSMQPHEIIFPNFSNGWAQTVYETKNEVQWPWGILRGGTPAKLVDDQYLAFFHTAFMCKSEATEKKSKWHYFMGAYTFSKEPPFKITSISPHPISHSLFYTNTDAEKRVIYPGGFIDKGDEILVAYGKDDREVWIAVIDKEALYKSLVLCQD